MTVEEVRRLYYEGKGMEKGIEKGVIKTAINLLDILDDEIISEKTGLSLKKVKELRKSNNKNLN